MLIKIQKYFIIIMVFCIMIYSGIIILTYLRHVQITSSKYKNTKSTAITNAVLINVVNTTTERVITNTKLLINQTMKPMKYILKWLPGTHVDFINMEEGQKGFTKRNCLYVNCYVTSYKYLLGDYTAFDAIIFSGPDVTHAVEEFVLPDRRSVHQKYVFMCAESAGYYETCTKRYNGFFNWTWTYKLNSDLRWGYIVIRDKDYEIIGPKKDMNWIKLKDMDSVSYVVIKKLRSKKKAAAWFVSNCNARSRREKFVQDLEMELSRYNHVVDVYGFCGNLQCPPDNEDTCNKMISDHYYFYLSFENSISEDYVTEKLLHALNNDAVPIVFGGANYTRFMPDGIYLNARELGVKKLAEKINELIKDPEQYAEYFRWKNHYTYHLMNETVETNEYCGICKLLNDEEAMNKNTVYDDFRKWWDVPGSCWRT